MSAPTRKHHTSKATDKGVICMRHAGQVYQFPKEVAEKYRLDDTDPSGLVDPGLVFAEINNQYGKAGALLKGLRIREGLTQTQLAKEISATQSDISQMEGGRRAIGRKLAQRFGKLFDVNYRSFLE